MNFSANDCIRKSDGQAKIVKRSTNVVGAQECQQGSDSFKYIGGKVVNACQGICLDVTTVNVGAIQEKTRQEQRRQERAPAAESDDERSLCTRFLNYHNN